MLNRVRWLMSKGLEDENEFILVFDNGINEPHVILSSLLTMDRQL